MSFSELKQKLLVLVTVCFSATLFADDNGPTPKPEPKYDIRVEKSVKIPMRDGINLAADLYFPVGLKGPLPVILITTLYNKNEGHEVQSANVFASQGFVVALQDRRGRWESEGRYGISEGARTDISDTADWVVEQAWSNGNMGTYGCSGLGEAQIFNAPEKNPHIKAMIPQAAGGAVGKAGGLYRFFGLYNGGAMELAAAVGWMATAGSRIYYRPPPGLSHEEFVATAPLFDPGPKMPEFSYRQAWNMLPVIDILPNVGIHYTPWTEFMARGIDDEIWDEIGYLKDGDTIDVPALHVNSWYDLGVADTLFTMNYFREHAESKRAAENQFAIISPTTHCRSEGVENPTIVGHMDVGDARFGYWDIYVKWFKKWLAGEENGVEKMPHVQYYVMGRNAWAGADAWPIPGTRFTSYFLHSSGGANGLHGDGVLGTAEPATGASDTFTYDPAMPVPTIGGTVCCTGTPDAPEGALDQRRVEMRPDVLVYSTPPLQEAVEVTGPIEAVLYVSSSAKDTDFTAKLVDVYPDGTAYNLQEGILRARYREGFDREVFMKPGEVYELRVNLHATSNEFRAGHRIRLEISSSNFPRFNRNLNTGVDNEEGVDWVTAENVIYHSAQYPSRVVLPIVPRK